LMYGTIFKSCPKLTTYLVSKIWVMMSLNISSKDFFGIFVCAVKWTSCLLVTNWFIGFGKPTQFEWSGPFRSIGACDVKLPPYNSLIVWTNESHIFVILFINQLLLLIGSCYLNTYCSSTWLHLVITTIKLIGALSCLKAFGTTIVIVVGLVHNIFLTFVFRGQLDAQC
jgi:hypothetical protein